MTEFELQEIFEICEKFKNEMLFRFSKDLEFSCSLITTFSDSYNYWKRTLPYHLNLIDELHANENAHSRILVKLLSYELNNQYPILQNFVNYFSSKYDLFKFTNEFKSPQITPEKYRIDALIIDNSFAIIIENKIHNAKDRETQILRYIQKVNNLNVTNDNIYIIYLSRFGSSPSQESFPDKEKELFRNRYLELSYRYDILSWLQSAILPNCNHNEEFLCSTLLQYIDHLKGLFHLRKIDETMNDELIKVLEKQLGLKNSPKENIKTIITTIDNFDKTREYLDSLLKINWYKFWEEQISNDFKDYELISEYNDLSNFPKVGFLFEHENQKFSILIEMETNLYLGVGRHLVSEELNPIVQNFLNDILLGFKEEKPRWYGWKYTNWKDAYDEFKKLAENIILKSTK